jgi:hypothetical protein
MDLVGIEKKPMSKPRAVLVVRLGLWWLSIKLINNKEKEQRLVGIRIMFPSWEICLSTDWFQWASTIKNAGLASNPRCTALETSTLTITPPMRLKNIEIMIDELLAIDESDDESADWFQWASTIKNAGLALDNNHSICFLPFIQDQYFYSFV